MKVSFSSNKKNDASAENHVKLPYSASKRVFPQTRWLLILVIVGSPLLLLLGNILLDWIFVTSPGTIWLEKTTINSSEAGTVEKVLYRRGELVKPDTAMFRVKRRIPENRLEQIALLEAERDAVNRRKDSTISGMSKGSNSQELQLAQESVAYYQQVRNDTKWLMNKGAATKAEMDAAENKLREAKASLAAFTSAHTIPAGGSAGDEIRAAQLEQSITALKKMTEEAFDIKSSQGGKVNAVLVSEGQSFSAGETLAVLVDTEQIHIVTYVDPKEYKKINYGTTATVKILGTGRKVKAVVEQSPVTAENVPSGISENFYPGTMRGVQVFLKVTEPLQEEEIIQGLPVEVKW